MTADQIISMALGDYQTAAQAVSDPLAKIGGFASRRDKGAVYRKIGKSMRGRDALWSGERVNWCVAVFRHVRNEARLVQKMAAECVPPVDCAKLVQSLDNAAMRLQCMDAWARKSEDSDALPFAGNRELFLRYTDKARALIDALGQDVASRRTSLYRRLCKMNEERSPMALAA